MVQTLMDKARSIAGRAIEAVLPEVAVEKALRAHPIPGRAVVVAIGKAAWRMSDATVRVLGERMLRGVLVTKDGHAQGPIDGMTILEAGHPVPDERALRGARTAIKAVAGLGAEDTVVFLISGGGSALFELPLDGVTLGDIADVTAQLLACGADIHEINCIRKHLSAVKGGRFAEYCRPARVLAVVLSDVLGDSLDTIASGPVYPDASTCAEARAIVDKYALHLSPGARRALRTETPKRLDNIRTAVTGNVAELCEAAAGAASDLGYTPHVLTTTLDCEASAAGAFLAAIAREARANHTCPFAPPCAVIVGGETVVHLRGQGLGGRNQELALAAAIGLEGLPGVCLLSVGSDGTDGPTDAAGGVVNGETCRVLRATGVHPGKALRDNDAYHALQAVGALVMTGATGTNVNDVSLLLMDAL